MKAIKGTFLILALSILVSCVSVETDPTIGTWDLAMDTPVGAVASVLTIVGDGTGSMSSDMFPEAPINDVMVDGSVLTFSAIVSAQGQTGALSFSGTVMADALEGNFDSSFGTIAVTGMRQ